MNIWNYQNLSHDVKLTTKNGKQYTGYILSILDADDAEADEAEVCLELDSGLVMGFWESQIESIEII